MRSSQNRSNKAATTRLIETGASAATGGQHIFILGPSGTRKTYLAEHLAADHAYLHIEIDRFPDGDGVDLENLRQPWDKYFQTHSVNLLLRELDARATARGADAAVVSFPSGVVLSLSHIAAAISVGIRVWYLYGSAADCIAAFLAREKATGRNLDIDHWITNNRATYFSMSAPQFRPFRVQVFASNGRRIPLRQICERVRTGGG